MRVIKLIAALALCIVLGAQCLNCALAEIRLHEDRDFPPRGSWDIHQANYTLFAKPPQGWVGDVMPMAGDEDSGTLRIFYLQDWRDGAPTYHPFHSFVTRDLVHFDYLGEAIPTTTLTDYDRALGTGSVTKIGGTWHAFYTGNNPLLFSQGKPREYIRHAVSQDGVHFTKLEAETFTASQEDGYSIEDFRDPFLFYNEEANEYWLLIMGVRNGKAVVARYRSADLSSWELMEPLLVPGTASCECPDLFRWGDWWYCVYSTDWETRYLRAASLEGPWERPPMESFDSHGFYAAKTGVLNGQRYLCGWIATRGGYSGEFKDTSEWDWAGNMAIFQLEQDADGWLSVHLPDSVRAAFGDPVPLDGMPVSAQGSAKGDHVTVSADRDGGGVVFDALPDSPVLISADITLSEDARGAGFSFGSAKYMQALAVELDMKYGLLRYDGVTVARMRYGIESSHISRRISTEKRTYHLDVLIDNDVAVFFLDNREALSTRIYRMPGKPWGVYVSDGEAHFDNLTMRVLRE